MTQERPVDILISYKSEERPVAERLAAALGRRWNVWWDHHLLAGDSYRRVIGDKLSVARCVVVLWSRRSTESEFVLDEAGRALRRGVLIPARIEKVDVPLGFGQLDYTDLIDWNGDEKHPGFVELCDAIARRLGEPGREGDPRPTPPAPIATPEATHPAAPAVSRPPMSRLMMAGAAGVLVVVLLVVALMTRGADEPASEAADARTAQPRRDAEAEATRNEAAPLSVEIIVGGQVTAAGTVIPSGLVVTPCHVLGDATEATLRGAGRWDGVAHVVERRCDVDLALLEPAAGAILPNASVIRFAGSLEAGEAIERVRGAGDRTPGKVIAPLERVSYLGDGSEPMRLLVTTNVSSSGDSGAPILDKDQRIVGLLVAGDGESKSLSIPSETIREAFINRFAP